MRKVTTTREYDTDDGPVRLHLHQVVHVPWDAVEYDCISWAPANYLVTDLDGDGVRIVTLPLDGETVETIIPHEIVPKLVGEGRLRVQYRGETPEWGY